MVDLLCSFACNQTAVNRRVEGRHWNLREVWEENEECKSAESLRQT